MPAKNSRKTYLSNGYYHLYNRGVEKRPIFLDQQDYSVFLSYLKEYLSFRNDTELIQKIADPEISYAEKDKILKLLRLNNFYNELSLISFCLMPNHFHFFVKQNSAQAIDKFMNSICTRYTMYFNKKYQRVGPLYQSVYKAVIVETEEQYIYLTKYIHKQAIKLQFQPSSYDCYIGKQKLDWVKPQEILNYFSSTVSSLTYSTFVNNSDYSETINNLLLDEHDYT